MPEENAAQQTGTQQTRDFLNELRQIQLQDQAQPLRTNRFNDFAFRTVGTALPDFIDVYEPSNKPKAPKGKVTVEMSVAANSDGKRYDVIVKQGDAIIQQVTNISKIDGAYYLRAWSRNYSVRKMAQMNLVNRLPPQIPKFHNDRRDRETLFGVKEGDTGEDVFKIDEVKIKEEEAADEVRRLAKEAAKAAKIASLVDVTF